MKGGDLAMTILRECPEHHLPLEEWGGPTLLCAGAFLNPNFNFGPEVGCEYAEPLPPDLEIRRLARA